jgi:hypothetical protein
MRPLSEIIDDNEPAWPIVEQWIAKAEIDVEVLPTERGAAESALHETQVTTRNPMGAIIYKTAGIFLDSRWLRIFGAGGNPHLQRSSPGWNVGRSEGYYLIGDDAVGGSLAINGGALGKDQGNIYYFAPDSLDWEPCNFAYSTFLVWAMTTKLREFYESLRWEGWQAEVKQLSGDQAISFCPFLFMTGPQLVERSRRAIPVAEQYDLQLDIQRQLAGQ